MGQFELLDDGVAIGLNANDGGLSQLRRYDDDGSLVWDVETNLEAWSRLEWDGDEFLYASRTTDLVRYLVATGEVDVWAASAASGTIALEVEGPLVVVGGSYEEQVDDSTIDHGWITGYELDGTVAFDDLWGDRVVAIEQLSSGGYVAVDSPGVLFFRGYHGSDLSFSLPYQAHVALVADHTEGLLVVANPATYGTRVANAWLAMVTEDGSELRHVGLEPCGSGIGSGVSFASFDAGRVWLTMGVPIAMGEYATLWVEANVTGELLSVRRVDGWLFRRNGRTFGYLPGADSRLARYE